jgi:hypothetical protein
MYSDSEDQQGSMPSGNNKGVLTAFGIYFCSECKNVMLPHKPNGHILEFVCQNCGPK